MVTALPGADIRPRPDVLARVAASHRTTYLTQCASFASNKLHTAAPVFAADASSFFLFVGFQTPASWDAGVEHYLVGAQYGNFTIRFTTTRTLRFRILQIGGALN